MRMETPFFLIHKDQLENNICAFAMGMQRNWQNCSVAYSVKTNSLPWVLKLMNSQGVLAEVVSDEEYELAQLCGFPSERIIFNGPIKTKECFLRALRDGSYVNIDSRREIEWIREEPLNKARIGVRVNVPPELFSAKDIEYTDDGFRFGFSEASGDFQYAVKTIQSAGKKLKIGLHLHCNSITRSAAVYRAIARYAVELAERYTLELSYIDVGGGFFGGVPGKETPMEYFSVIRSELEQSDRMKDVMLIAEPGSALIGSVVDLYTSVIDVKDTSRSRIVTTDGSRIHIDPLWKKSRYLYTIEADRTEPCAAKQIICGYTCMDHDRLMVISNEPELQAGDRIIYHRVGAYSMTFGGPFIRYYPDVYVQDGETIQKVRSRFSTELYYKMQTEG